jgi:ComF family protein
MLQENILMSSNHEAPFISGLFASKPLVKKISSALLDFIFPPMCHGCGRVDTQWCDSCLEELVSIPTQIAIHPSEILSESCSTGTHRGKLQEAIQSFKFYNTQLLSIPLGERLTDVLVKKRWTFDTIIPVPLHTDRQKIRGYNQAYLLSQQVEKQMNITCQPYLLTRHRNTPHQVGLSASERRENVKDAFVATSDVVGKSILLIDDVVTTGTTLDECATALFNAGASSVYAITVSHA